MNDRPLLATPAHLRDHEVRQAIRERVARQPGLGLAGLTLVLPVAVLFAIGAGGAERSLILFAPLVTFALPVIAMIAFWWEDWPGTSLRPAWSGWFDTLLVALGGILLTMLGQIVVDRLDVRGIFVPSRSTAFPDTLALAGAAFIAMVQITLVCEGWPLRRLGRVAGGAVALAVAWGIALLVYADVRGLVLVGAWQVWLYVMWQGWPFASITQRWLRLLLANVVVIGGRLATYAIARAAGATVETVTAAAATFIAAGLTVGMLFEGAVSDRWVALAAALVLAAVFFLLLQAYADTVHWAKASAEGWIAHAALNAYSVGIILHVAIGRRRPFG